jgi:hypothetical protein
MFQGDFSGRWPFPGSEVSYAKIERRDSGKPRLSKYIIALINKVSFFLGYSLFIAFLVPLPSVQLVR